MQPETVMRRHRNGLRYYWRCKSRGRGRPKVDPEISRLIRKMSRANPLWGAPRIHGQLLKLGIDVCEATVSKYMIKRRGPPSQSWRTFLDNHADALIGLDIFTVPTASFRILFVLIIISHACGWILHFTVTEHRTARWTARQLVEACGIDEQPRYLVRDRDTIYGYVFQRQAAALAIREVPTVPRSPWQDPYAERVIGSIRRECVDHAIIVEERHLRRILGGYVNYYHQSQTHLSSGKDAPVSRHIQGPEEGQITELPRVGGLYHEYVRMAA